MAEKFDLVHFHTDHWHFPVWGHLSTPQVTTLHGRLDVPDLQEFYRLFPDMAVVSISNVQRRPLPNANWVATVYNSVPLTGYTFQPNMGDYLLFLGRFTREKGPEQAIEIAKRCGMPIKLAAKIDDADRGYFKETIVPLLADPLVEYVGEADDQIKDNLLKDAAALLFPISWPEPFGLVMVEAMVRGTPVIAFRAGSVDEIMQAGVTGFVVDSIEEGVAAVAKLDQISRKACRDYATQRFSVSNMVNGYLGVYHQLLASQPSGIRSVKPSPTNAHHHPA